MCLARLPVIALVFAGFFAGSWRRPLYAAAGTMSFFIIFTRISRARVQVHPARPLIFSDIALVVGMFFTSKTIFVCELAERRVLDVAFLYRAFSVSGSTSASRRRFCRGPGQGLLDPA